jgi:hypothetical protein
MNVHNKTQKQDGFYQYNVLFHVTFINPRFQQK